MGIVGIAGLFPTSLWACRYCVGSGPELTRNLPNRDSAFDFIIEFSLDLIGQKMNHRGEILKIASKI